MKPKDAFVNITDLHPEMQAALAILDETRRDALQALMTGEAVITAGKESGHSEHSLHHDGLAIDIRTKDFAEKWAWLLEQELAAKGFDVVVEKDHIHIERDPKKKPLDPFGSSVSGTGGNG